MASAYNEIRSWAAKELKYWEQATLERIVASGQLTAQDLSQLVVYFLEDVGLAPRPLTRPKLTFPEPSAGPAASVPCRLVRIFDLKDVNALPSGQEIAFCATLLS